MSIIMIDQADKSWIKTDQHFSTPVNHQHYQQTNPSIGLAKIIHPAKVTLFALCMTLLTVGSILLSQLVKLT